MRRLTVAMFFTVSMLGTIVPILGCASGTRPTTPVEKIWCHTQNCSRFTLYDGETTWKCWTVSRGQDYRCTPA